MNKVYRNNLNNFINRFGKLYKEPPVVPKTNKDNACICCGIPIVVGDIPRETEKDYDYCWLCLARGHGDTDE